MKILVIGAGAVGGYFGGRWLRRAAMLLFLCIANELIDKGQRTPDH